MKNLGILLALLYALTATLSVYGSDTSVCSGEAMSLIASLQKKNGAIAEVDFNAKMKQELPPEVLLNYWAALLAKLGALNQTSVKSVSSISADLVIVKLQLLFEKDSELAEIACDKDNKISGFHVLPNTMSESAPENSYTAPAYAFTKEIAEQSVTLGGGTKYPLEGTIVMPTRSLATRFPAVVLLAGSGPVDRWESVGDAKPFRDIALGLASRGIVVITYDKRTHVYPQLFKGTNFTIDDEETNDAQLALKQARSLPYVEPHSIFLLGHSLGALVAPKVAKIEDGVAGLIIMAAPLKSIDKVLLRQVTSNPRDGEESKKELIEQVQQLDDLRHGKKVTGSLPLDLPASYWLSLDQLDPVATTLALNLPVLVLQGAVDAQVLPSEGLNLWKKASGSRPEYRFISYPGLDHLFIDRSSEAARKDSLSPHVNKGVVDDIAAFIFSTANPKPKDPGNL